MQQPVRVPYPQIAKWEAVSNSVIEAILAARTAPQAEQAWVVTGAYILMDEIRYALERLEAQTEDSPTWLGVTPPSRVFARADTVSDKV